jgi:hypothetical protein
MVIVPRVPTVVVQYVFNLKVMRNICNSFCNLFENYSYYGLSCNRVELALINPIKFHALSQLSGKKLKGLRNQTVICNSPVYPDYPPVVMSPGSHGLVRFGRNMNNDQALA